MENKERQILSEIMDMMASIRSQLELLDAKVAELQLVAAQEDDDMAPIDLDLDGFDDLPFDEVPQPEVEEPVVEESQADEPMVEAVPVAEEVPVVEEPEIEDPVVDEPEVEDEPEIEETVVEEQEEVVEAEPVAEEDDDDDLPIFAEPEPVVTVMERKSKPAVIDSMTDRQAWRTDMPGSQVKDIRSAISLNDRILFINTLFGQDPMAFQEALTRINQMATLDEVVEFVTSEKPLWNLESDTVYRFMMAVRRKVR